MIRTQECKNLMVLLGDYIDGSLSDSLCAELEKHLAQCQDCRIVVDTMRKTIDLYREANPVTGVPADVRARLFYRLNLEDFLTKPAPTPPTHQENEG